MTRPALSIPVEDRPLTPFDIRGEAEPSPEPANYDDPIFEACLIIEARIREFEADRETSAPAQTLFYMSDAEMKLQSAQDWLFAQLPDWMPWIVKL
jgi:hypothetical protein